MGYRHTETLSRLNRTGNEYHEEAKIAPGRRRRRQRQLGPRKKSESAPVGTPVSHVIAVTQQDNGEFAEEIVHRDWVEVTETVESDPRAHVDDREQDRWGRPALINPERLMTVDPVPGTIDPSDLEDPAPGTLPRPAGRPARTDRSR